MKMRCFARGIGLAAVVTGWSPVANAEMVTVKCQGQDSGKPYEMTMAYDGGDSGTMMITGSFGEMSLPAASKQREGAVSEGNTVSATEIWASGEVPLTVPDKAGIEACIKTKLPPDQVTDADIVFSTIPSCAASAPMTAQPIPIKVYAEIGILDPQTIFVTFKRTYLEKSDLPDGVIVLEPIPPPNCTLVQ